ncbi:transposase family protein [Streptomyces shenzhenensis]|uniref:transposase family protein n=1 Tax=Streptomyces shenzhenensis TaxID=943815 RepID=UPI001F48B1FE|nr:transposase family protein [Streptomyces shenzhenensis]
MPAASSSPIPAGLGQLAGSDPARPDELPDLLARLSRLPDPRRRRGRRHPLSYVLALAACGVLAGAKSLTAIAEWAADASDRVLLPCGATLRDPDWPYRAPSEATVRRVLQRIDGDALDAAIGGWLTARADAFRTADRNKCPPGAGSGRGGRQIPAWCHPCRRELCPPALRATRRRHCARPARGRRQE